MVMIVQVRPDGYQLGKGNRLRLEWEDSVVSDWYSCDVQARGAIINQTLNGSLVVRPTVRLSASVLDCGFYILVQWKVAIGSEDFKYNASVNLWILEFDLCVPGR